MNTDDAYVNSLSWSRDAYNVLTNTYVLLHICKLFDCLFMLLTFVLVMAFRHWSLWKDNWILSSADWCGSWRVMGFSRWRTLPFLSIKLNSVVKRLEDNRKAMVEWSCDDRRAIVHDHSMTVQSKARNPLKTSVGIFLSKVKKSKVKKRILLLYLPHQQKFWILG